jgi:hypothetical protein
MVGMAVITGMVVTFGTIVATGTGTAVEVILAPTKIVTAILTVAIAATKTAIGAGALLLVVTRLIIASAGVTPAALPEAVAQLVRQESMMAPMTAPAGKFAFHYVST